jgi:ribosomal protein S25
MERHAAASGPVMSGWASVTLVIASPTSKETTAEKEKKVGNKKDVRIYGQKKRRGFESGVEIVEETLTDRANADVFTSAKQAVNRNSYKGSTKIQTISEIGAWF